MTATASTHPHERVRAARLAAPTHLTVVSPHLDDAVLSCFTLMRAATEVTVITVFAGIPAAGTPAASWDRLTGAGDPRRRARERRAEDRAALAHVGGRPVHLDLLDGPYRSGAPDRDQLVAAIADRVPRRTTLLAVPAGFGTHPDHHGVAAAGPEVAAQLGLDLVAYADYPYAAVYGWPAWVTRTPPNPMLDPEVAWAPVRRRLAPHGLTRDVVIDLDRATQQAKLAAFGCYASQVEVCEFGPSRMVSGPARLRHELLLTRPA